ncbi:MAG TPA: DUF92 domain-containing protein [Neobacillus sp.]|jgi:uncharacterized protein (TIGR00297 family)
MIETISIFIIIMITSLIGYLLQSLTFSGAIAASLVGVAVFAGFGVKGLILLGVFFATSSLWSKYKAGYKRNIEEKLAKGATRDWRQVVANGGAAALFSMFYYLHNDLTWLIGFIVTIASANSDTWASEIGPLSKKDPLFIRTFRRIERGTSGAVSLLGSGAAMAGSLLISLLSFWLFHLDFFSSLIILLFGFLGNVIDTVIGAFYQQLYICRLCGIETEKRHHCQIPTIRIKGFALVDNDMVNFISGMLAAIFAIAFIHVTN